MSDQSTPEQLSQRSADNGFSLNEVQAFQLSGYINLLLKWNKVMNLVGPQGWEEVFDSLILDSFHLARFIARLQTSSRLEHNIKTWDFGAGAGLPGIPLRILWQNGLYTMVEAREKRALFLRTVLAQCKLPATEVFLGRVENFMGRIEPARLLVSRAFMPWPKLLELMQDKLDKDACILFLTLEPSPQIQQAELTHHWKFETEEAYKLPGKKGQSEVLHYFWLARKMTNI